MTTCKLLAFPVFVVALSSALFAEQRCPRNLASVPPRVVANALFVISVRINQSGPFDFMVDTGSQITIVDPALASQLSLRTEGTVGLVTAVDLQAAPASTLNTMEVGLHVVERVPVAILDLGQIRAADPRIRGILGENFLEHFDLLIDYRHKLLCLDEPNRMQSEIKGERIPLVRSKHAEDDLPFTHRLVVSVHLSGTGRKQILLQLDSGSNVPIIYSGNEESEWTLLWYARLRRSGLSDPQAAFAPLPPQNMRLGSYTLNKIPFVTPAHSMSGVSNREEDGILPTMLFQRVYFNNSARYVVFEPK